MDGFEREATNEGQAEVNEPQQPHADPSNPKATKPSEDNQRHSNKVESIEVLISQDFIQSDIRPRDNVTMAEQQAEEMRNVATGASPVNQN